MKLIISEIITLLAALVGIVDSILSTLDHLRLYAYGSLSGGYCQALMAGGCKSAHTSRWSEFLHVPISIYGIGFYFTIIALILAGNSKRMRRIALPLGLGISLVSILYCAFLAYILYRSGNFCPLCGILYAVNIILVIGLYLEMRFTNTVPGRIKDILWSWVTALAATIFVVVTLAGVLMYSHALKAARAQQVRKPAVNAVQGPIPSIGPANAPIHVVEISDFLCPYCARLFNNLETLRKEMPNQVRIGFLQYPLDKCNEYVGWAFHPSSCMTAAASLCADKHGKFWAYARALYKNRHRHTLKELSGYAADLGMDEKAFQECVQQAATIKRIQGQTRQAHKMNVRGTPTFVVNGRIFIGAKSKKALRMIIKNALRNKNE